MDDNAFWGLGNLSEIRIFDSDLRNPPSLQYACNVLTSVSVTKADLRTIPTHYFQHCQQLHTIDFSKTHLRSFPNISPIAHSIRLVYLSSNLIESVYFDPNVYFERLKLLKLNHNRIHALSFDVVMMPNLQYLLLKNNRLSWFLDPSTWNWSLVLNRRRNRHSLDIELKGNPWDCNNLTWLQKVVFFYDGESDGKSCLLEQHTSSLKCNVLQSAHNRHHLCHDIWPVSIRLMTSQFENTYTAKYAFYEV